MHLVPYANPYTHATLNQPYLIRKPNATTKYSREVGLLLWYDQLHLVLETGNIWRLKSSINQYT